MTVVQAQAIIHRRTFLDGEKIFCEGDDADHAYLVESGAVRIVRTVEGRTLDLATVDVNGVFGEMALIDGNPRMACAIAQGETRCLVIPKNKFAERIEKLDAFSRGMMRVLCANLRLLTDRYVDDIDMDDLYRRREDGSAA